MKKHTLKLELKKSKIADLHTIYGGGTNSCDAPLPFPYPSEDCNSQGVIVCTSEGASIAQKTLVSC